jgi:hypothetical protein
VQREAARPAEFELGSRAAAHEGSGMVATGEFELGSGGGGAAREAVQWRPVSSSLARGRQPLENLSH